MSPKGQKRKPSATSSTIVVMVIDKSGSMEPNKTSVISSFNEYLQTVRSKKKKGDKMLFSMVQFDHNVHMPEKFDLMPIEDVPEMTDEDYTPHGMTAMYDGLGMAIDYIDQKIKGKTRKPAILFVVLTDGLENASKEYTSDQIKTMIGDREENGNYSFVYLGANQDAWEASSKIGIRSSNTAAFTATASGTWNAVGAIGKSTNAFVACARGNANNVSMNYSAFNSDATVITDDDMKKILASVDSAELDEKMKNVAWIRSVSTTVFPRIDGMEP